MNTKAIGNIGEAKVLAALVEMNIPVYMQFGDNELADYIVLVDYQPYKIQVKTSMTYDGEKVKFDLCSSTMHRKNGVKHLYTREEIDLFMCYDCKTDKIFVIANRGGVTQVLIRYNKPKNNQVSGIRFAHQYALNIETLHEAISALNEK